MRHLTCTQADMYSVQCLRELINERLTAAAEEIFTVFQKTIIEYEKEIDRQRRLLDILLKPEINVHRIELPQQHVCKEEAGEEAEVLADQQLCNQERNSSLYQDDPEPPQIKEEQEELCISLDQDDPEPPQIKEEQEELCISLDQDDPEPPQIKEEQEELCTSLDQDDPEPPQIKEEQEELCISLEGEQLILKKDTETFMFTPSCEESDTDNSEDQILDLTLDETESSVEKDHVVRMSIKSFVVPEPNSDQLLSHNAHVAESQDHKGGKHEDSRSTRNAESQPQNRRHKCNTCGKVCKWNSDLRKHLRVHTGEKPYTCNTCGKRFSEQGSLKRHMNICTGKNLHTGNNLHIEEKLYPCNTCEKRFSHLGKLKVHMRLQHRSEALPM